MKKKFQGMLTLFLICALLTGSASAAGFLDWLIGSRLHELNSFGKASRFNETVDALFAAMDAGDADAIRDLFAPAVRESVPELDAQIVKLLELWPGSTDLNLRDEEMANGGGERKHGRRASWAEQIFPVISQEQGFVCLVNLMYENDMEEEQIGIQRVILMNLDTRYALMHDLDGFSDTPDAPGLHVMTDYDSGLELRFVNKIVEQVNPMDRVIPVKDVRAFLAIKENCREDLLKERFGEPNTLEDNISWKVLLYELQPEGEPIYMQVFVDEEGALTTVNLLGEMRWIEKILG